MQANIRASVWIVIAAVLAIPACSPVLPAPLASETPSLTPDRVMTALIETLAAAPTFTSTLQRTPTVTTTPFPSITPVSSFTPFRSLTPTPTLTSPSAGTTLTPQEYSCQLLSKNPDNWARIRRRTTFDAVWNVKNTGTKIWKPDAVVLNYVEGAKLQSGEKTYPLTTYVSPGESVTLIADMITPKTAGTYISTWGLMLTNKTKQVFCTLLVRIVVY